MNERAELSINFIVLVVIALLVLVIVVYIFGVRAGLFLDTTECVASSGECVSESECSTILDRDLCGPFRVCCSVIE